MSWFEKNCSGFSDCASFCPETALFRNLGVILRICLCGVKYYASAQMLDFLDLAKNYWFPKQKHSLRLLWCSRVHSTMKMVLLLLSFLLMAACQQQPETGAPQQSQPFLVVGNRHISVDQFSREMKAAYPQVDSMSGEDRRLLEKQLTKQLIDRELIFGEAARLNISYTPDELDDAMVDVRGQLTQDEFFQLLKDSGKTPENWVEALKLKLLTTKVINAVLADQIRISDQDAISYYRTHKPMFDRPEEIRARQMLFKTREDALKILARLHDGEDFAELARDYSLSPDSENGGSLGYFARGQLPEEFDKVLFKLPVRQVSNPVKSPYGYHLFLVERKRNAGLRPFAAVKDEIIELLSQEKEELVFQQWLDKLQKTTQTTVNWELLEEEKPKPLKAP